MNAVPQPSHPSHFEVCCPLEKSLLNILRRFIVDVAEEMGFCAEDLYKIEMAVDEACSNVFLHAYDGVDSPPHRGIELNLHLADEALTISVRDRGQGHACQGQFVPPADLDEYNLRNQDGQTYHGLGIYIMQQFMDEVQFMPAPDSGTLVTLRKYLRRTESAPSALSPGDGI